MRLFDRIASDGFIWTNDSTVRDRWMAKQLLTWDPVRVAADQCAELFWTSERNDWHMGSDTGPLRAPFDQMWVEWVMPKSIFVNGQWGPPQFPAAAAHVMRHDAGPELTDEGCVDALIVTFFVANSRGEACALPLTGILGVEPDGSFGSWRFMPGSPYLNDNRDEADQLAHNMFMPALIAIGLMNCKNVTVSEDRPRPLNKAQRRRGGVRYSYHVIHLPKASRRASRSQVRQEAGPANAFHLVRGHFKTYTDENPLFGRVTGTYWWGWHGRGDVEAGVSLHDYST